MKRYEVKSMDEYTPDWHKGENLVWKKLKGKKKPKQFPEISISKIVIPDGTKGESDILIESEEQYEKTGKIIPVYLSYDFVLLAGYEQILLAKELDKDKIPYQRLVNLNRKESKDFRKSTHNRPIGNKKYPIRDVDGNNIYVTDHQKKIFNRCYRMSKQLNVRLEVYPGLEIRMTGLDAVERKSPYSLKGAHRKLMKLTGEEKPKKKKVQNKTASNNASSVKSANQKPYENNKMTGKPFENDKRGDKINGR